MPAARSWTAPFAGDVMSDPITRPHLWRVLLSAVLVGALWASALAAQDAKPVYRLQVDGLACPFCAYGIEKQLGAIEGVASVETEIRSGSVVITMAEGSYLDEAAARKAVEAAGFTMRSFKREENAE